MTDRKEKPIKQAVKESPQAKAVSISFEEQYPVLTNWVSNGGWIEMGYEIYTGSFVSALDEGGMIWEGAKKYRSVSKALEALEKGIAKWVEETY